MLRVSFALFAVVICSGCSTLVVSLPQSRFDSPEVAGKTWKKHVSVGIGTTTDVTVVQNAQSRPPDVGTTVAKSAEGLTKFSMGFGDSLEVGIRYGILEEPLMLTGKFQMVGDPELSAKEGNFSITVSGGVGWQNSNGSGDQSYLFGPGGYGWNASENTTVLDGALIFGYRVDEGLLIYGGPFFTSYKMAGNISQAASSDGSSPAANFSLSGIGQSSGANLAFQVNPKSHGAFSITFELDLVKFAWTGYSGSTDAHGALICDWLF